MKHRAQSRAIALMAVNIHASNRTHQYWAGRPPFNPWHHYTAREFAQSGFVFEGPRALLSAP
jgi:hypothetical protein